MKSTKKLSRQQVYGFVSERQDVELNIGNWDMTDLFSRFIAHGLTSTESKTIKVDAFWIRNDADNAYYHNPPEISVEMVGSNLELNRIASDKFDTADFDTASDYNRGKIFFSYINDLPI